MYRETCCARTSPLPLLPSGPGGVGGIAPRRARHMSYSTTRNRDRSGPRCRLRAKVRNMAPTATRTFVPVEEYLRSSSDYEPDAEDILHELLPRNLAVQVFRALLENAASFYGAQMSAMDNATRNAGDMIRRQTLFYNRTRQAQITKELIEIISGAEAL